MKKQEQSLCELYEDFLADNVSPDQTGRLKALFKTGDEDTLRNLVEKALKDQHSHLAIREDEQERLDGIYMRVKAEIDDQKRTPKRHTIKKQLIAGIAAAAVLAIAALLHFSNGHNKERADKADLIAQVEPGSNKAILTLSDGGKVDLSALGQGLIRDQSGASVTFSGKGTIVYNTAQSTATGYNTIETPNGGEFRVVLPDGTKVWLNAASSLKYPTSFDALNERRIELSGEAYFEVSHNKNKPFRVVTSTQTIEVLGTHFNVNSYADEGKTTTTLAEGSVKVTSGDIQSLLKPGQQAIVQRSGNVIISQADLETALAWKDGNIVFRNADIRDIMRQIGRWYNIEVAYEGRPSERLLTGGMPRNTRLSVLLDVLKDSNIAFKMEETAKGKRLVIVN